jgi:hypothetical protein
LFIVIRQKKDVNGITKGQFILIVVTATERIFLSSSSRLADNLARQLPSFNWICAKRSKTSQSSPKKRTIHVARTGGR